MNRNTHTIITISREYGSNGKEIGQLVAKKLNIAYYDKEILEHVAQTLGISSSFFQETNLNKEGLFSLPGKMKHGIKSLSELSMNSAAYKQAQECILSLVEQGSAVLVGRCANHILKEHPGLVSVYCWADLDDRVERVIDKYDVPASKARKVVLDTDARRAKYYEFYTHRTWGDPNDYDKVINTSKTSLEESVNQIVNLYYAKEEQL